MNSSSVLLSLIPSLPVLAAIAVVTSRGTTPTLARWAVRAAGVTTAVAVVLAGLVVAGDAPISASWPGWGDGAVVLVADRLGAVLVVLAASLGWVVQAFAARAMAEDARAGRFFALASLLTGASALVALGGSLIVVAAGWLATSAVVASLVGLYRDRSAARRASTMTRRALAVGDLALLGALGVVAVVVGDLRVPADPGAVARLQTTTVPVFGADVATLHLAAVLLVVAGIARSALVPLHRWLPATLAAPTPVSALLHAGVINGAGVLLVRHASLVGASTIAMALAFTVGVATAVLATSVMSVRPDTKGALAWSTSGQMGFMVVQVAVGAFGAAVFHLVGHALFKAAAFLGAGGVIDAARTARHLPRTQQPLGRVASLIGAALLPAVALGIAFAVVRPDLDTAKLVLIVVFAGATASRFAHGWLRSAPLPVGWSAAALTTSLTLAATGYVAAIAAMERFLGETVAVPAPGRVGATVLALTILALAVGATLLRQAPGERAERLRLRVYAWLVSTGAARIVIGARRRTAGARRRSDGPGRGLDDPRPPLVEAPTGTRRRPGHVPTEVRT
jgi:NAD(P)H-quinone oxidoreductase subunit 5